MRSLGVLLMVTGAGATLVVPDTVPAAARRRVEAPAAEAVPLVAWRDLSDRPCRWLGRNVRLRVQVESKPADWNPFVTRFGTGQFDALQAWADEQFPWIHADYDAPGVRVFVRKGGAPARVIADSAPYAHLELTGVVREVFLGLPWIEVVGADRLSDAITEASVIHAARAIELMNEGVFDMALLELDQAMGAPLPDTAALELARLREVCLDAQSAGSSNGRQARGDPPER